ncbi:MAG: redox-sensing transcriptional repressor Rex [bacterium]
MKNNCKVLPKYTLRRITDYLNVLYILREKGISTVSSSEIAKLMDITDVQVRKDLSCFDSIGKRGVGYNTDKFIKVIESELGLDRECAVVLIGVGRLGTALMHYKRLAQANFVIKAGFDISKDKVGKKINGILVRHIDYLDKYLIENKTEIVVMAIPAKEVPGIMSIVKNSDVKSVLNLSPTIVSDTKNIIAMNLDIVADFKILSYKMKEKSNAD